MTSNVQSSDAPLWLKNVGYFNGSYLGDLLIFKNAVYYVSHTNVEAQRNETQRNLRVITRQLGLIGVVVDVAISAAVKLSAKSKPTQIKIAEILASGQDAELIQNKLDEFIGELRKQSIDASEHGLIKPLRFAQNDVKNVRLGIKKLKFDSEYDNHDFNIGYLNKKSAQNALRINGFLSRNE